jgi:hypothetical protein
LLAHAIPARQLRTYNDGRAVRETGDSLSEGFGGLGVALEHGVVAAVLSQQQAQHLRSCGGHLGRHTNGGTRVGGDTPEVRELQVEGTLGARKLDAGTRDLSVNPSGLRATGSEDSLVIQAAEIVETIDFGAQGERHLQRSARAHAKRTYTYQVTTTSVPISTMVTALRSRLAALLLLTGDGLHTAGAGRDQRLDILALVSCAPPVRARIAELRLPDELGERIVNHG